MKRIPVIAALVGAALIAGCGGESSRPEATGKGRVRAINAIQTAPEIDLLIEERLVGSATYKSATGTVQYDDLEYTFNVEAVFPSGRERVASRLLDIVADKDYTFVISGALASPTVTVTEADIRIFAEGDTVFERRFGHFNGTVGDVDVYFDIPGVAPVLGQQVATLSSGDISAPAEYAEGDYVLIFTAAGDPGDVLFTSDTLTIQAQTAVITGIFDADMNELGQVAVRSFSSAGGVLSVSDVNVQPTVRFFQTSAAVATADIYNDDPTMFPPIVTNHAFGEITGDIPVMPGLNSLTYTGAGGTSTILFEQDLNVSAGLRFNYYLLGETDTLGATAAVVDRRPVETFAKFSILHAAFNHPSVDFYIAEADADITDLSPLYFGIPAGTGPLSTNLQAGSFDMYITEPGEKTVITGPIRLDTVLGDIVNVIVFDNVDPAIADLVFVPDP